MHNEKWHKSVAKSTKNAIKYRREMNKNRAILYMFIYIKRVQKLHYYQFYVPKNSKHKTDINANNKTNVIKIITLKTHKKRERVTKRQYKTQ
jgi:hypothetical protein